MSAALVKTIVTLLPTAVDLTRQMIELIRQAQNEGIEVPEIDEIKTLNEKLKNLPDL